MRARAAGRRPDLVDRVELAERLGVGSATMSRWHRRAILPDPDLRFGTQDVWLWETIQEWARARSRYRKPLRSTPLPDVVDLDTLATRLEIEPRLAETWHKSGFLPEPDYRWEKADGWLWETIQAWERTSAAGRIQGRDSLPAPPPPRHQPRGPRLRSTTQATPPTSGEADADQGRPADAEERSPAAPNPVDDVGFHPSGRPLKP